MEDKKEVTRSQKLPGSDFSPGSVTLFQIAESKGQNIGQQATPSDATILEKDAEILKNAIPADKVESVLRRMAAQAKASPIKVQAKLIIIRGMKLLHKPTRKMVVVTRTDVDTTDSGDIRHEVCLVGSSHKFRVPEKHLKVLHGEK